MHTSISVRERRCQISSSSSECDRCDELTLDSGLFRQGTSDRFICRPCMIELEHIAEKKKAKNRGVIGFDVD